MHSSTYLATLAASLSVLASARPLTNTTDYGSWLVNVTSSSAASGFRWGDVYASYSGFPEQISHVNWQYSPMEQTTTYISDNPKFGSSKVDYAGDQAIELWQNVTISGEEITLYGSGVVTMKCGIGGNGRSCAGEGRVEASLTEGEVVVE